LTLRPDPEQSEREAAAERRRLDSARAAMHKSDLEALVEATCTLKRLQETPDTPEALATIPALALDDLPRRNKVIPSEVTRVADTQVLYHDLATNGVLYLDLGFDLHVLPADLLPYVPLFARALLETGAGQQGFVRLSQRVGRTTGGIRPQVWISATLDSQFAAARLFLRAKAVPEKGTELLAILRDVLLEAHLNNQERLKQLVLEEKASKESSLVSGGSHFVDMRIRANFHEADWAEEQIGGVSYLGFLRKLAAGFEASWPTLSAAMERIRSLLITRAGMLCNDRCRELAPFQARADFLPGCVAVVSGRAVFLADWRRTQFGGPDYSGKRQLCGQRCQPLPFGLDAERCGPRRRQISPHDLAVGYGPRSGRRVWRLLRA
jgi:presequence protease